MTDFNNIDTDAIYRELSKGGGGSDGEFPQELVGHRLLWKSKGATLKTRDDRAVLGVRFQPSTAGGLVKTPEDAVAAEARLVEGASRWLNVTFPGLVSKGFRVDKDDKGRLWTRLFFQNTGYRISAETAKKYGVEQDRPASPQRVDNGSKVYRIGGRQLTSDETRAAFARCDAWDAAAILDLVNAIGNGKNKAALDGYWITGDAEQKGEYVNLTNVRSASELADLGPAEIVNFGEDSDSSIPF
jgi:hypothetical protein